MDLFYHITMNNTKFYTRISNDPSLHQIRRLFDMACLEFPDEAIRKRIAMIPECIGIINLNHPMMTKQICKIIEKPYRQKYIHKIIQLEIYRVLNQTEAYKKATNFLYSVGSGYDIGHFEGFDFLVQSIPINRPVGIIRPHLTYYRTLMHKFTFPDNYLTYLGLFWYYPDACFGIN